MERLLSIDPGGSGKGETGIVLIEFDDETPATCIRSWVIVNGLDGFLLWLDDTYGSDLEFDYVVCEHFVNYNVKGADLTPVLIEGSVRTVFPADIITLQPAAGKNEMVKDEVLKRMNMWFPGDHHHDRREASRHALIWLKNRKHVPTLEAMYDRPN
jgi:hypothetical protein